MSASAHERRLKGMLRDLGPVCGDALKHPKVIEIMLNPDGRIFLDELGKGMYDTGYKMPIPQSQSLFNGIASMLGTVVTAKEPILEGELPVDGSRFEGLIAPVVAGPTFAIRKKASLIFTLEDYERTGIITHGLDPLNMRRNAVAGFVEQAHGLSHGDIIRLAIKLRKNILVIGSTSSGKTTLVNACIDGMVKITPEHRIVLIEDTGEIQCAADNYVQMRSNADVSMTRLLKATMRLRPDRIIVGEVRDGAVLALLKMWNTGHPGGLATIHANDCEDGLLRVEQLVEENPGMRANPHVIAGAIDLCIFIEKETGIDAGRKVRELAVVEGYDSAKAKYIIHRV
jgi:type IV secretion system protein VirB11